MKIHNFSYLRKENCIDYSCVDNLAELAVHYLNTMYVLMCPHINTVFHLTKNMFKCFESCKATAVMGKELGSHEITREEHKNLLDYAKGPTRSVSCLQ